MKENLHDYRQNYDKHELLETAITDTPIELFDQWFMHAKQTNENIEPNVMTVSTVDSHNMVRSRILLLKEYSIDGFVFFTNYLSTKGRAIATHPQVCLSFFWEHCQRQVIISGIATKVAKEISDQYFASRPRNSQLGAHLSQQSEVIKSRAVLDEEFINLQQEYKDKDILRPSHWGGYRVVPVSIEFWQGRPNRLHDRICYALDGSQQWSYKRLAP